MAEHMIRGDKVVLRPVEERDRPLIQTWQNHVIMSVDREVFMRSWLQRKVSQG